MLRRPAPAIWALCFQLSVGLRSSSPSDATMLAFGIHAGVDAAALVLLLMNVVTIFPFWPGNIGLVQAAIALALLSYGVNYAHGVAFGVGLQAIEASVGIGPRPFLSRARGLHLRELRRMPDVTDVDVDEDEPGRADRLEGQRRPVEGDRRDRRA